MTEHRLEYRAGLLGFGATDRSPHWHCSCGAGWTFAARAMPNRSSGNNRIEAERAHAQHAHELTPAQRDAAAIVEALLAEHPELDTMEGLLEAFARKLAEQ